MAGFYHDSGSFSRVSYIVMVVPLGVPARGATTIKRQTIEVSKCFNPRPRAGGDSEKGIRGCTMTRFQSTPPRGGRPDESYNPHVDVHVSIHAPARGATGRLRRFYRGRRSFNPRPRAGGDPRPGRALRPGHRFNPRPRAGGDTKDVGGSLSAIAFQSTPPRGGRLER